MKLISFNSTAELLGQTPLWNDLWQRSECTWPTMRAEPLAQWINTFGKRTKVRILAVEQDGRLVAGLPLLGRRTGPVRIGALPGGDLCSVGDVLVEGAPSFDLAAAMIVLTKGMTQLRWPLLRFDAMFPETARWQALMTALDAAGCTMVARHRGMTGVIELQNTWDAYFASRSRNHRRHMRVAHNRALDAGDLQLYLLANPQADQLECLLHRGFEAEDRSWKGKAGTSTLRSSGAFQFFLDQARLLSASRHLLLAFLNLNDTTIAFEYGWQSKGVYHSLKVGYDETYSHLSPGQLLRYLMIERLYASEEVRSVDYLGPLADATSKWITRRYPVGRLVVANGKAGRLLLAAYQRLRKEPPTAAGIVAPLEATDEEEASVEHPLSTP